jgi:nucleoid-associated protein YgaU
MRPQRIFCSFTLPVLLSLSGCGYAPVRRLPPPVAPAVRDDALAAENAGLQRERTMLQRELALTRAQGEALRSALQNRAADGDTSKRLVDKLNETTRELGALRTAYARLQGEKPAAGGDLHALQARLGDTEEKLAAALRSYTQLQEEVGHLRRDLARTRAENLALSQQVKAVTTQNLQAQAALAQLNTDLLAQRDARFRAEQDAQALRTELKTIAPDSSILAQQRIGAAGEVRSLAADPLAESTALKQQIEVLHAKVNALTAEGSQLKDQLAQLTTYGSGAPELAAAPPPASRSSNSGAVASAATARPTSPTAHIVRTDGGSRTRFHIVAGGDTLARISTRYYGTPGRWNDILTANRDILGDSNNLVIGRTLRIP